jgi:hypothetical protein
MLTLLSGQAFAAPILRTSASKRAQKSFILTTLRDSLRIPAPSQKSAYYLAKVLVTGERAAAIDGERAAVGKFAGACGEAAAIGESQASGIVGQGVRSAEFDRAAFEGKRSGVSGDADAAAYSQIAEAALRSRTFSTPIRHYARLDRPRSGSLSAVAI